MTKYESPVSTTADPADSPRGDPIRSAATFGVSSAATEVTIAQSASIAAGSPAGSVVMAVTTSRGDGAIPRFTERETSTA